MTAGTPIDVLGMGLIEDDEYAALSHGLLTGEPEPDVIPNRVVFIGTVVTRRVFEEE